MLPIGHQIERFGDDKKRRLPTPPPKEKKKRGIASLQVKNVLCRAKKKSKHPPKCTIKEKKGKECKPKFLGGGKKKKRKRPLNLNLPLLNMC